MSSRKPFVGIQRKLVLAFDLGTTYSGISYSVLDPGLIPEVKGVTRFPAQEHVGGDAKIPSIIYYDQDGVLKAAGAEALQESIIEQAEEKGWIKSEWFKLHLRPKTNTKSTSVNKDPLPSLPPNKTAINVFADFLKYLFQCATTYIQQSDPNGKEFWSSIEKDIEFILSHPNGWGGAQQAQMRHAAVQAGLVPDDHNGHARISFVTEGEASLHYCINNGLASYTQDKDDGVIIVDAGGGTIDLSAYSSASAAGAAHAFEEIAAAQCHFTGSIFVTNEAKIFLEQKLKDSKFAEDLDHIVECFDRTTKLRFGNPYEPAYIKFGTIRDKDLALDIRSGQMKLAGSDVATFFEPSVKSITQAISEQRASSKKTISSIFLVGGFAASDYLFMKLQEHLVPLNLNICRPDSHVNKAVADGAISFYLDHYVSVRVSRMTYGVEVYNKYDPNNTDHVQRKASTYSVASGDLVVPNIFDVILAKDTQVSETKEFRRPYYRVDKDTSALNSVAETIRCYKGDNDSPRWLDVDASNYSQLCTVVADMSEQTKLLAPQIGDTTLPPFYRLDYDVILLFGLTELKAQVCWKENGVEKRSNATLVYDNNKFDV